MEPWDEGCHHCTRGGEALIAHRERKPKSFQCTIPLYDKPLSMLMCS